MTKEDVSLYIQTAPKESKKIEWNQEDIVCGKNPQNPLRKR